MSEWKGLDPGGTEQLWDSTVLLDVLNILKSREPFSRGQSDSAIYDDLEDKFSDITWRNFDVKNSFRPIFRKTNPWAKLGLVTDETNNAYVTPLGDELISSEKTLTSIFVEATKNHVEPDGTPSFAIMCKAAIELPTETFSLEDVEYAVSKSYADGSQTLADSLNHVRSKKITFPSDSRRKRTLRSFLNALVSAGALVNVADGWTLHDKVVAAEIAGGHSAAEVVHEGQQKAPFVLTKTSWTGAAFKDIPLGKRAIPKFDPSSAVAHDPIKRALLLEKANSIHESLVEKCAEAAIKAGLKPIEDLNSFDMAVVEKKVIVEVKSINLTNAVSQLRKAVAQLPEYRWRHRAIFDAASLLVIVTNQRCPV